MNYDILSGVFHPEAAQLGLCSSISEYLIIEVTWWEERTWWRHQYLVIQAVGGSLGRSIYIRVERDKWGFNWWTLVKGNLTQYVSLSDQDFALTVGSAPLARFSVEAERARSTGCTLDCLGRMIRLLDRISPTYTIVPFNCWLFASGCFINLLETLGPEVTAYRYYSMWCRRILDKAELHDLEMISVSGNLMPYVVLIWSLLINIFFVSIYIVDAPLWAYVIFVLLTLVIAISGLACGFLLGTEEPFPLKF